MISRNILQVRLALFAWVGNTEIKYQHVGIYVRVLHALDKIVTTVLEDEHKSYTEHERVSLWFQGYAKGVKKDHTDCSMFLNFILARRPTPNFWVVSMSQLKQFSKCLLWKKKLNFHPFNARLNVGYFVATYSDFTWKCLWYVWNPEKLSNWHLQSLWIMIFYDFCEFVQLLIAKIHSESNFKTYNHLKKSVLRL